MLWIADQVKRTALKGEVGSDVLVLDLCVDLKIFNHQNLALSNETSTRQKRFNLQNTVIIPSARLKVNVKPGQLATSKREKRIQYQYRND